MFDINIIIKEVAKELNLKQEIVEEIIKAEFRCLHEEMSKGAYTTIKLKGLGKFYPNAKYNRKLKRWGTIQYPDYKSYSERKKERQLAKESEGDTTGLEK